MQKRDVAVALIRGMRRIRHVEESIAARYGEQEMRCPTHLSTGQEAVATAVSLHLRSTDLAVSGHRAHAHYLAKGGDLKAMLAEIYGKEWGCARGKGGSMHLIDESVGFMGSTAIVGGTVPVGVGLGLSLKLAGGDALSCVYMGDAVAETGVLFESANFAVLKQLPILFVCENNRYSVYSSLSVRQPNDRRIHAMMASVGMSVWHGDGNDVAAAHEIFGEAVAHVRTGAGPAFVEMDTYRWREHCGPNIDDELSYRPEKEIAFWRDREPIERFEREAVASLGVTRRDIAALQAELEHEVSEAFIFARQAPFPSPQQAFQDLYADTAT